MKAAIQIHIDTKLDQELREKGYVIIPFLSPDSVKKLKSAWFDLHPQTPPGFYASTHAPDTAYRMKVNNLVMQEFHTPAQSAFPTCQLLGGALISKAPGGASILQPHQDWNIVDESQFPSFNIWVPLIDVDEKNGAVCVLPHSHRLQPSLRGPNLPPVFSNINALAWSALQSLPMKAGEALVYDHRLLHGSPPNGSDQPRLAAVFGMIPEAAEMRFYHKNESGKVEAYQSHQDFFLLGKPWEGPGDLKSLGEVEYDFPQVDEAKFTGFLAKYNLSARSPKDVESPPKGLFARLLSLIKS